MHARITGFISIKGGVGKTSTVANVGALLAKDFGRKVLVVDANFSGPNLGMHFGFLKPEHTIHDVLEGKVPVHKAIYEHESGLHILPASLLSKSVSTTEFKKSIQALRPYYDSILVDSSPCLNEEILATITASDELFVLTTPDYVTLASTMHALKTAKEKKVLVSGIVLNKVRGKKYELSLQDLEEATDVPVVSILNFDQNMIKSLSQTTPAAFTAPKSDATIAYRKLAAALVGERYKDPRFFSKLKNLFSKGLSKEEINRAIVMESHY